jgi:uncharacterized membrane protein
MSLSSVQQNWVTEHRSWEDFLSVLLGIFVAAAPIMFVEQNQNYVYINAAVVGIFIIVLGFMQLMWLQRWEEHLELLCGLWVIGSPYLFDYAGQLAVTHYILGFMVAGLAALELWQDRNRSFEE